MHCLRKQIILFIGLLLSLSLASPPDTSNGFYFEMLYEVPTTPVKNQARTGTCWSFAGTSFIETEIIRLNNDTLDLSEMFFVRNVYPEKALNHVRLHGNGNIGPGSLFGDVLRSVKNLGFVPEEIYSGMQEGDIVHNHTEFDAVLNASLNAIIKNRSRKLSPAWPKVEKDSICKQPEPELTVDQSIRQQSFDNYTSKDDHLMHIVGLAKDQNGTKYYKTKNSWGVKDSEFEGYLYMSESFIRSKAVSIVVAKEAVGRH